MRRHPRPSSAPGTLVVLAALVGVAFTGCAVGDGPGPLSALERPATGRQFSEAARTVVAAHAGQTEFDGRFWFLPGWLSGDWAEDSAQGDRVRRSEFSVVNLGLVVLPMLPLWFSNETRIDGAVGGSGTNSTIWTPLYCGWSATNWPPNEPTVRTAGFPLLYSRLDYGRPGQQPLFNWNCTLWTLGPAWARIDFDEDLDYPFSKTHPKPGDSKHPTIEHAHGWVVLPVLFAGIGSWLWTSAELESTSVDMSAHGPLNGLLGYKYEDDHVEHERTRKIIGGILWYDTEESDAEGSVYDSRHGPLWGMFGWGVNDGEPGLRVFWIPIGLG